MRATDVRVPGGRVGHAVDREGRRHLLVPLAPADARAEDRTSRGVTITVRRLTDDGRDTVYLDVACEVPELQDLFADVCDEMLQRLQAAAGAQPAPICRDVLERWRELLAPAHDDLLGRERLAGLLAELHFLERAVAVDPGLALRTWTGPDRARIDFTGAHAGVEVKATTIREGLRVEIHGLGQLDPGSMEELYLYAEQLEPVPIGGDSVPDAQHRLCDAGVDKAVLLQGLAQAGYSHLEEDTYQQVRFRCLQHRTFRTTAPGFPRLIAAELRDPTLTDRIRQVRYTIDLTDVAAMSGLVSDPATAAAHLLGTPA